MSANSSIPAILGPTCCGKTAVAVAVARRSDGEVVSCDSMQVYRELDKGTAKPTAVERAEVPHHLIDILGMDERCDANRFRELAKSAIRDIQARGRMPVLAGGSGMYARSLIYDLPLLPSDEGVFRRVVDAARTPKGMNARQSEVAQRHPATAEALRANPRRLMRAVEVLRLTGRLPDEQPERAAQPRPNPSFRQFVLVPEPDLHRRWIRTRTADMLKNGWMEEVAALERRGLFDTPTARQALGYRDIADFLKAHTQPSKDEIEDLAEDLFLRTWHYARRQRTWFRNQHPEAHRVPVDEEATPESLAESILSRLRQAR